MTIYTGSCYCGDIKYSLDLLSPDDARTSLCHCKNCKKFFGGAFGLTTKVSRKSFTITAGQTKEHVSDNGAGHKLHREFCATCGSGILEWAVSTDSIPVKPVSPGESIIVCVEVVRELDEEICAAIVESETDLRGTAGGLGRARGEPKTDFTYIMYGTLDKPGELPPKGEFFCKRREAWMPEIPGVFHKKEIKE